MRRYLQNNIDSPNIFTGHMSPLNRLLQCLRNKQFEICSLLWSPCSSLKLFKTCSYVVYHLFMICSWLPHGLLLCSWINTLNLFLTCSWLVHDYFMTSSWLVHDKFITCSLPVHYLFLTCSWLLYDLLMTWSLLVNDLVMICVVYLIMTC